MDNYKHLTPFDLSDNLFEKIGKNWMLVGAADGGRANALTASWGGTGVLFNTNVAIAFIRRSRYTRELLDASGNFSLSFFKRPEYDKMYGVFGSVSGRDEDKISKCGLTVSLEKGAPLFAEASLTVLCRKLVCQPMELANIVAPEITKKFYPDGDFHYIYIGEIIDILEK